MAAKQRRQVSSLKGSLIESFYKEPFAYEFHQAIKLLEMIYPEAVPLGEGVLPGKEAVQLKSRIFLSAPANELYSLEPGDAGAKSLPKLSINFFGIAGLQGPLPTPYTELILERISQKDTALRDFLDIFNHRLASILHRIRKKHWVGLDTLPVHKSHIGQALLAFSGALPEASAEDVGINPRNLLFYAGLLWQQPRSGAALAAILSDYFEAQVKVQPFKGRWLNLDPTQTTIISPEGQFNILGQGASLGTKVWDILTGIKIKIGPLNETKFRDFLKNGEAYPFLIRLAKLFLPKNYHFEINLIMKAANVLPTSLNGKSALGWTSWLCHHPRKNDDDQVRLYPNF
ncbi:MAG: type VI secretion system baseplate subunit TssG [Alphaproteobacteria bacterium]|nr:type VI secretion system baseplate subunit TssG [Alphaproteobacteria bacterium]